MPWINKKRFQNLLGFNVKTMRDDKGTVMSRRPRRQDGHTWCFLTSASGSVRLVIWYKEQDSGSRWKAHELPQLT